MKDLESSVTEKFDVVYSRIEGIINEYATKDQVDRKLVLYTKLALH